VVSKVIMFETREWAVADQMTASFKRAIVKGAATIDEADLDSIRLYRSRASLSGFTWASDHDASKPAGDRILSDSVVRPKAQHHGRTNALSSKGLETCTTQSRLNSQRTEIPHYA
jgi:hypothetical protein